GLSEWKSDLETSSWSLDFLRARFPHLHHNLYQQHRRYRSFQAHSAPSPTMQFKFVPSVVAIVSVLMVGVSASPMPVPEAEADPCTISGPHISCRPIT
ncbi:hypothetical protein SISNIDRAFT_451340, partial [Sistotremastrum niveocremeum HHB9708]